MTPISRYLHALFGRDFRDNELVIIFSARLDETGTDERSPYTAVGGAVSTVERWGKLETAWSKLLSRSKVSAFHTKEFEGEAGDFAGWSNFKRKRFVKAQEKIIRENTLFKVAVGLEDSAHAEIKEKMKGIKRFMPDSNYGLCFRYLMFLACEQLEEITPDFKIIFMLEDGPWAAGAVDMYTRVSNMTAKWKPAKHAHRLGGITVVPKGESLSLEVADYLVGVAHNRMLAGRFTSGDGPQISYLLNRSFLNRWYEGMLNEKERRRAYWRRRPKKSSPSGKN